MNTYWTGGMSVEPAHHDGDQPWYEEALVSVAGRLFPPRFRISLRCAATKIEMCTAVEVEQGGFIEPDNATSVAGLSSGVEKDYVRASARKLALPLALATMPDDAFEQSSQGWTWAVAGWSPGSASAPPRSTATSPRRSGSWPFSPPAGSTRSASAKANLILVTLRPK